MKKNTLPILLLAVWPSFVFAEEPAQVQEIVVTAPRPVPQGLLAMRLATNYIVRNLNGDQVCRLGKNDVVGVAGIAPDSERVNIKVLSGPCKDISNGFVYVNYLRPTFREGQDTIENALVEIDGLSLRRQPSVEDGTFACSLKKNTKLKVLSEKQKRTRWVEVEVTNAEKGCPTKGWVAGNYLKPDIDLSGLHKLNNQELTEARTPKDCADCAQDEVSGGRRAPIKTVVAAGADIQAFAARPPVTPGAPNPFLDFAKELQDKKRCPPPKDADYKCNRGLMEMPVEGNAGFCGTHHYSPDRPPGVDTYTAPHTACSLIGLAQEWKKTACPNDNAGCRIAWGDISHKTNARFNRHQEHTRGECIDIRPFNKGSFRDAGRTVSSADYDRDATVAFLKLAKKYGGDIRFSDRRISNNPELKDLNIAWGGSAHNNHMHICFESSNAIVQNACDKVKVDPTICSEVQ